MLPPSTKNGSFNIYRYMVGLSKLTPAKRKKHAILLLHNYHNLCNTNVPSSMLVSPPSIPNIESLSRLTISSLGSGSFGRNRYVVNIRQQTTFKVAYTETVMAYNKYLDLPPPQDISNVFAEAYLSSC